jgi:hypothetical protein
MRLFSYKLKYDTGFAPNPFHGVCTLATCKSEMRKSKLVGDWIAGFTSSFLNGDPVGGERLVYLMQVSAKLGLDSYYRSREYAAKIPGLDAGRCVDRAGDNIYFLEDGRMRQVENPNHGIDEIDDDTGGEFVLVGRPFYYFGRDPLQIPAPLRPSVPRGAAGEGYRTHDEARARAFVDFVASRGEGVHAPPHRWPDGDDSWRQP